MNNHFVFIYGSLRVGSAGSISSRFPRSKFVAKAQVNGNLYDLGAYPGLILNESNAIVTGEIYEVDNDLLSELDEFEATSNYVRKQVEICFGAQRTQCWTYEPNPDFYRLEKLITSGDWIEYARAKTHRPDDILPDEES